LFCAGASVLLLSEGGRIKTGPLSSAAAPPTDELDGDLLALCLQLDEQRVAMDAHDVVWDASYERCNRITDHNSAAWKAALEESDAMSDRHGDLYSEWKDLVFEIA
jgi:hypothetical protein